MENLSNMEIKEIKRDYVKQWVVLHSAVTNPYKRETWYASATIGYDYNGSGKSIEEAYNSLTDEIFNSPYILGKLCTFDSFINLIKPNPDEPKS